MGKSRLQKLMETPEKDLKTFRQSVEDRFKEEHDELNLGESRTVVPVTRTIKKKKFITVEHQWNGDDFVWHMSSHPKKPWKVDSSRLVLAVAQCMNNAFPRNTQFDIWRPVADAVPEWTFRAYGVRKSWAFDENKIYDAIEELLTTLNTLV